MRVNVAVTDFAASIVTTHEPVPVHAPLQPPNVEVPSGVAVSVTIVPIPNDAEHVAPQLMPAGLDVTLPLPVPDFVTLNANVWTPDPIYVLKARS
jgi:hypothetical protein